MNAEGVLILALSVASTVSAGVSAGIAEREARLGGRAAIVIGANLLALPLLAWLLGRAAGLGAAGAGLVIAAAAPGGSTGPLMAVVAGGDARAATRLFLMLTLAGTAGALAATIAVDAGGVAAVARAAAIVLAASVAPLLAGFALGTRRRALGARLAPWLSRLSLLLLVATIGLLAARHLHTATAPALGLGAVLVVASLAIGLAATPRAARLATAQVSAVRNLTLALVVLAAVDAAPEAIAAVLSYGLVMYIGTGVVAVVARRR